MIRYDRVVDDDALLRSHHGGQPRKTSAIARRRSMAAVRLCNILPKAAAPPPCWLDWHCPKSMALRFLRRLRATATTGRLSFLTGTISRSMKRRVGRRAVDFVDKSKSFFDHSPAPELALAGAKGGPAVEPLATGISF